MNFSIYLDDKTNAEITDQANLLGKSKNTIIREAIEEWLKLHRSKKWSKNIMNFQGDPEFKEFESYRDKLDENIL